MQETNLQLSDDMVTNLIANESDDPDYGSRLNELTKEPLRCILLSKGPEGVVNELKKYIGPSNSDNDDPDVETFKRYYYFVRNEFISLNIFFNVN